MMNMQIKPNKNNLDYMDRWMNKKRREKNYRM